MKPTKKPTRPVTHSVRLEREVYQQLAKEASDQFVSFNNLASRILKKHVEFDRYIPDLQFFLIHKQLVRSFMEPMSENLIVTSAVAKGGEFARDAILTMGLPLNRDSLLYFLDTVLCRYKNFADCQRSPRDGKELFYLRHELGAKWSLFLKGYVTGAFKNILNEEVEIETTKEGINFLV